MGIFDPDDGIELVVANEEVAAWRKLAEGLDGFFRVADDARIFRVGPGRWWVQMRTKRGWTWLGEDHPSAPDALAAYRAAMKRDSKGT